MIEFGGSVGMNASFNLFDLFYLFVLGGGEEAEFIGIKRIHLLVD